MTAFTQLFDEFDRNILPHHLTDADILRLRHEAFALDLGAQEQADFGTDEDHFVYVAKGAAKLVAYLSSAREQIVAFGLPGELIHVPGTGDRNFALIALEATELLAIPAKSLLEASGKGSTLLRLAIEQTILALGRSRENSIMLGTRSARERLAGFLLDMFERGTRRNDPPGTVYLPMSRNDIADSLGMTIETVSRQFSEMRNLGLIETRGRSIVAIRDWEGLAHTAGQMPVAA
tara:strand:- start:1021 stop:1722 length:702 start_codon:yes stop_codon:yes gene_type:complete